MIRNRASGQASIGADGTEGFLARRSPAGFVFRGLKSGVPRGLGTSRGQRRIDATQSWRESDASVAFALFVPMLFMSELGTIGAALFSAVALLYVAQRARQLRAIVAPRAFLLAIPFLALLSTMWSEVPGDTLKYSLEFALTIGVGLVLSAAPRPQEVLWGIFLAFAVYIISALTFGQLVNIGANGQTAFSGLTASKNLLADIASTGFLLSAVVLSIGIEDRRPLRSAAALLVAAAELYALLDARSAGAVLGLALGVLVFAILLALRSVGFVLRVTATAFLSACLVGAALVYRELSDGLIEAGTRFFDKDMTLTGRTYLWQRASDFIAEKPLLGKGFNAFWLQGNPDAEGMWHYAGITDREGFSFHNTFVEILVHLGWSGVVVIGVTPVFGVAFLFGKVIARPSLALSFWASVLVYQLVRMPIETIGFTQFYFSTVLLFAALGSAFAPRRTSATVKYFSQASYSSHSRFRPIFDRSYLAKPSLESGSPRA